MKIIGNVASKFVEIVIHFHFADDDDGDAELHKSIILFCHQNWTSSERHASIMRESRSSILARSSSCRLNKFHDADLKCSLLILTWWLWFAVVYVVPSGRLPYLRRYRPHEVCFFIFLETMKWYHVRQNPESGMIT